MGTKKKNIFKKNLKKENFHFHADNEFIEQLMIKVTKEFIKEHKLSKRPDQLAPKLLELLMMSNDSSHIHSKYLRKYHRIFEKYPKENWLLTISNSYEVGKRSKQYEKGKMLLDLESRILSEIKFATINELIPRTDERMSDILVEVENIDKLSNSNIFKHIRGYCILGKKRYIVINNKTKYNNVYGYIAGREYSVFSQMSKKDREYTDTPIEIDLSTAVQSVMLNQYLLIDLESKGKNTEFTPPKHITDEEFLLLQEKFPAYWEYVHNKKEIREGLARGNDVSIEYIKSELTKITFRGGKEDDYGGFMKDFFKESMIITSRILKLINTMDDRIPIKKYIKKRIIENSNKNNQDKKPTFRSKIFFWYEYQERRIRDAMIEFARENNVKTQQVHDCIYVNKELDRESLKHYIYQKTGFRVVL